MPYGVLLEIEAAQVTSAVDDAQDADHARVEPVDHPSGVDEDHAFVTDATVVQERAGFGKGASRSTARSKPSMKLRATAAFASAR